MINMILLLILSFIGSAQAFSQDQRSTPLKTILFGSCIKQAEPMPILKTMQLCEPDLLLMLGDNIYADTSDMKVMQAKYNTLAANADFAELRTLCPTLAVWDDHDYGVNDGGSEYSQRDASQQLFANFWKLPQTSRVRTEPGVYDSYLYGPVGKRIQIILLDTRYFRSPLKVGSRRVGGPYYPDDNPEKTMLGEAQWAWLKAQLRQPAQIRIVATGIQCVASAAGQETWANLPLERQRLFDLIDETKANGVFIVSGDRHWAEFSCRQTKDSYPIYDFTSSSFNQKHPRGTPTENQHRCSSTTFHEENFGVISISWESHPVNISIQIRDINNNVKLQEELKLEQLKSFSHP